MPDLKYHESEDRKNYIKLKELLSGLPKFSALFFRAIEPRTQSRTRLAYAYDINIFFNFIKDTNPEYTNIEIRDFDISLLDKINARDIEEFMEWLKYRPDNNSDNEIINKEAALKRKLSSLKSFYRYFFENELISTNPAAIVKLPKIHEKEIIRLDYGEISKLLDEVESGEALTEKQKAFHKLTKNRDLALLSLLLGTGMRISECVGIDINDIDIEETAVNIHRKGGKEETIYFSDEVASSLKPYIDERKALMSTGHSEPALFLSLQNKRLSVRSAENLVKKYALIAAPLKHITPHKLRSTYGTNLYRETGDIYLVADVLGHSDVNTTKKHYAAISEDRKRGARKAVKLRDI